MAMSITPAAHLCTAAMRATVQRSLVLPAVGLLCRPSIEGRRNLEQVGGPCVVVANHQSHLDVPLLLAALPAELRRRAVVPAAADYWFASHRFRALAAQALTDVAPLQRRGGGAHGLGRCREALRDGGVVLIFPEGTRSRSGELGAFHRGAAVLAMDAGVPVVPVAISGVHDVLAPGAALPHPGRCGICVGEPIATDGETVESLTAQIEMRIRGLRAAAAAVVEA